MTTPAPKVPWFKSQGFWILALIMIALRFGYKYWRQEQRPDSATRMEQLQERSDALKARIIANQDSQRAAGSRPVLAAPADTVVAADSAARQ
jgi:predicted negative regulator of RcsB-dependent stress response